MRKNNPKKITTHLSFLCIQINVCLFGRGNYIATKRSVAGSPEKKKRQQQYGHETRSCTCIIHNNPCILDFSPSNLCVFVYFFPQFKTQTAKKHRESHSFLKRQGTESKPKMISTSQHGRNGEMVWLGCALKALRVWPKSEPIHTLHNLPIKKCAGK